jgi:beta-xylosidase
MFRSLVACTLLLLLPAVSLAQSASVTSSSKMIWKRAPQNPVIPAASGTLLATSTGAPDILLKDGYYFLYFYGQAEQNARIGVSRIAKDKFDGITWDLREGRIVELGPAGSCDEVACIDPSAVDVGGRVFLYYVGVNAQGKRSICLTISNDGIHFTKYDKNPIMAGSAPEAVYYKKDVYLFYRRPAPEKEGYQIYCATSKDGYAFEEASTSPVLNKGPKGSWDAFSVATPRIFSEGNTFYMMYSGSDQFQDYPQSAGLATSTDLIHWTKYSKNPVFSRGYSGTFDEGAVWFPCVVKAKGRYYMYYQGFGGSTNRNVPQPPAQNGGKSQVGMATLDAPVFYTKPVKTK